MPTIRRVTLLSLAALTALLWGTAVLAGTLRGQVTDAESEEGLIGVDLVLVGTLLKAATDLDGNFVFADVPPGTYDLRVTYLGYNTRFLSGLELGPDAVEVDVALESFKAYEGDDMVVSASRVLNTESALLADRKQSAVVGDAISAAQISRSPDGNAGDALKRVPGLTVNSGKYVYVRGVTDRYNVTEVNGVTMSGVNVDKDRKSFNFDMVPANLLANVVVVKTATPDMPGDFAGGLVRISTLEFPERATTSVGVSASHTSGTTGDDFHHDATTGSTDWLGIDDGDRDYPWDKLKYNEKIQGSSYNNELARALPNRWTTKTRQAPPRSSVNASHGNKVGLFGGDLGYVGALTYRNKYDHEDTYEERQRAPDGSGDTLEAPSEVSHYHVNWGGLANLFYRKGSHRFGLVNLYNRSADMENKLLQNGKTSDLDDFSQTILSWQERYQLINKLDGKHKFRNGLGGFEVTWQGHYGEARATEPDRRYYRYNNSYETPQMAENMRTWTWLDEFRRGVSADVTWSLAEDDLEEPRKAKFKAGFVKSRRDRDFISESWDSRRTRRNGHLAVLPPDTIFHPDNYNAEPDPRGATLWNLAQDNHLSGLYTGKHDLEAFYGMADLPFSVFQEEMRLTGGVRIEDSLQFVEALKDRSAPDVLDTAVVDTRDVLPSVNLTWMYDRHVNVRLGYYRSVNRPEFREMAAVQRRNYRDFSSTVGNARLERATIDNYDVRLEYFPDYGEVVAISGFYKNIAGAIEDSLFTGSDSPYSTWSNAPEAKNWGFEVEARVRLDFATLTEDVTVYGNYARIWSEVGYFDTEEMADAIRPLSGQAPWSVNAGLLWDNPNYGTSVNLLFNKVGRRLRKISNFKFQYIYLEPRDRLDLVVTRKIGRSCKLKLSAKDVLGQDVEHTSGTEDATYVYSTTSRGGEYKISLSVRF